MKNEEYVTTLGISEEAQTTCLDAMKKYGENHWWEPDVDPRKLAYYQSQEPVMFGSFSHFKESMELLLGRPVYTHEFVVNKESLAQEVERAWTYQVGCTTDTERRERVQEGIEQFELYAQKKNIRIVKIVDSE